MRETFRAKLKRDSGGNVLPVGTWNADDLRKSGAITGVEKRVGMVCAVRTTPEPAAGRPMVIGSGAWLSGYRQ